MDFRSKFKSCPKVGCGNANDPANLKIDSSSYDPVQSRMDHRGDPVKPRVDRGGDLARQVIDKNARFAAQRIINKTNDELEQVLKRVDNIFSSYEFSESATRYRGMSSLEFINNLSDLEDIMKDQFKRHKYQDRIRIFIVGYEKICDDKLKLIQQLNEFFLANMKKNKDEIEEVSVPELDLDSLRDSFNETISSSEEIVRRISEKHDCILKHYQQKKPQSKGKKKIDQALNLAKEDINRLNDNLSLLQKEMEQKEETVQQLMAQLETKNKEIQRYKASIDVAKNNSLEISRAKADIALRDDQIVKLQIQVGKLEKEMMLLTAKLADSFPKQLAPGSAKPNNGQMHQELGSTKEKRTVANNSNDLEELAKKYELYIEESKQNHSREIEELNEYYEKEIQKLQSELEDFCSRCRKESISRAMQTIPLRYSRRVKQPPPTRKMYKMHDMQMMHLMQTYLPNVPAKTKMSKYQNDGSLTKDIGVSQSNNSPPVQKEPKPSNINSQNTKPLKKENLAPSEPENLNAVPVNKTVVKQSKPPAVKTVSKPRGSLTGTTNLQNNSQVTTTPSSRRPSELLPASRSTRRSDAETIHIEEFADSFDLADEEKWITVPQDHVFSRFQQYRKLTVQRMTELEDQMASNVRRTQGKVKEMKKEFVEFQTKWSQERQSLLSKIEELMKLKVEAESDVESALNRFEEFIEQHPDEDTSKNKEMKTSFISRESEDRIEPEILEKMTDDAKAMSRDSTRLSSGFVLSISNLAEIADVGSGVFPTTLLSSSSLPHMPTHKSVTWSETIAELRKRSEQRKMETPAMPVVDLIQMPSMVTEDDDDDDDPDLKKKLTVASGQLRDAATSPLQLEREATNKSMKTLQLLSRSGEGSVLEEFHRISKVVTSLCDNIAAMCPPEDLETPVDEVSVQPKTADEIKENITEMLHETEKQIFRLIDGNDVTQEKYTFESDANSPVILDDETSILDKVQEAGAPDLKRMVTSASDVQNVDDMRQESNDPESSSTVEHLTFPGLKHQYEQLQKAYESEKQLNAEKQNYNASLFAEMQTTISTLKNELASLRTNANDILQTNQPTDATSPMILFTRLDSERNTKVMMQAISEKRINEDSCQKVLETMDEYVSLPIERLGNMVQRYIYQKNFKDINDSINRTAENGNQGSEILTRMDSFQKKRLQRFNHRSAILSSERRRLADNLTDMLADLEQESGIFLIKPLFSYKSSYDPDDVYRGKRTRVYQPRRRQIAGPTPVSTFIDGFSKPNNSNFTMSVESTNAPEVCLEDGIQGESKVLNGESTQPLWTPNDSTNWSNFDKRSSNKIQPNVPRLLELDVNRVTIGNNQISVNIPTAGIDSLGSGTKSSCSTRTYVNFNRHSGSHSSSLKGGHPCTPYDAVGKENSIPPVRPHSTHGRSFVSTPPLPPINVANDSKSTEGE